jgi:zinc finger protein
MKSQLKQTNPFSSGDSASEETRKKLDNLIAKLDNMIGLTIILDDPTGNTFVEQADDVVHYERTVQQNDDLGLNDMKVDNY